MTTKTKEIIINNSSTNSGLLMEKKETRKEGRRDFLKWSLTSGIVAFLGTTLYPILSFLKPPKQVEVEVSSVNAGKIDTLPKGESRLVRFGTKPVIVIHTDDDKIIALSATCTHLDCTVQYKNDEKVIWCACHNGKYNLHGQNVSGPPPKPLSKYLVSIKNNDIIINKEV